MLFLSIPTLFWAVLFCVTVYCSSTTSKSASLASTSDQTQSSPVTPTTKPKKKTQTSPTPSTTLQPLPLKGDTFEEIRSGGKVFVDKTPFIEKILDYGRSCILLIRPQRLGKKNFIQMLAAFFKGEKHLFNGTKILERGNTDKKNGEWVKYPVIYLDFGKIEEFDSSTTRPSAGLFQMKVYAMIEEIADSYEVSEKTLDSLVKALHKKFSLPVVVLVNEYDRPFEHFVHRPLTLADQSQLERMEDSLERFFATIKALSEENHVRFAFVTGVAKISSGYGSNKFITLGEEYSCMVGFTDLEIRKNFEPHINEFAKSKDMTPEQILSKLSKMYGGYKLLRKSATEVMSPESTLQCLRKKEFGYYQRMTNSLQVVIERLISNRQTPQHYKNFVVPVFEMALEKDSITNELPIHVYMVLRGYLIIKAYDEQEDTFTLDYPNEETEETLTHNFLLQLVLEHSAKLTENAIQILDCLDDRDIPGLVKFLDELGFQYLPDDFQKQMNYKFIPKSLVYTVFKTLLGTRAVFDTNIHIDGHRINIKGNFDLQLVTKNVHYVMKVTHKLEGPTDGMEQLIEYIINAKEAFLDTVARHQTDAAFKPTDIYLLSLNFIDGIEDTTSIHSFIGIPFQATDPKIRINNTAVKRRSRKIWFSDKQTSSNAYLEKLKIKFGNLASSLAVW